MVGGVTTPTNHSTTTLLYAAQLHGINDVSEDAVTYLSHALEVSHVTVM